MRFLRMAKFFSSVFKYNHSTRETDKNGINDFNCAPQNTRARYLKIRAKNIGICPEWHGGSGGKAWLFVDEVMVE